LLDEFLNVSQNDNSPLEFEQVPFNHPLAILYSSGTRYFYKNVKK